MATKQTAPATNETQSTEQKSAIVATIDAAVGILQLSFKNGKTISIKVSELPEPVLGQALLHGLKQKLVDAAAISRDPDTGRSATLEDKFDAVKAVADRLLAGSWNANRGEGGGSNGGLLFRALCKAYPTKTEEQIREYLEGKTDGEKTALRNSPKISPIIAELREATGKKANIDTDALLAGLE